MDSLTQSAVTPNKNRLARTFTKVLASRKTKPKLDKPITAVDPTKFFDDQDEKLKIKAFISKLFATISSVKAAYAQLQYAQSPYNPEGIQSADQIMVSELKTLSEFKQTFLKKHLDDNAPGTTQLLAEIQEQKNMLQMYEITTKTMDSQKKLKQSEIIFLKEKLDETNTENKSIERRIISSHEKFNISSLSIHNFLVSRQQTTKSIKSLVKFMMSEMEAANWDLNAAASSIQPGFDHWDEYNKCYAFESFVCRVMFDGFNDPSFSIMDKSEPYESSESAQCQERFFDMYMELKSFKASEYITWKPNSMFSKFCWFKYLKLVHPIMEYSLFGNLNQRNLVASEKFPDTTFFWLFADVAKRVWLLHCLAFAFDRNKASVFQVRKGSRFSEVYMESVDEDEPRNSTPEVAFNVVPGFKLGKTVIQCRVYLT
ncbi:protein GRAVITROPIC IN THE LIGHT 1-like [Rutidosis leptorrhynchoides]|uniref:protein GRAVITROPIC IN THE LIGHT 1-like n=1 Tax=Rutidosis leptorrhynchoides TaxID=125765 RepID=UPI003A9A0FE2